MAVSDYTTKRGVGKNYLLPLSPLEEVMGLGKKS